MFDLDEPPESRNNFREVGRYSYSYNFPYLKMAMLKERHFSARVEVMIKKVSKKF